MRSPASPWSATSRRSAVPMSLPSGILPGGNVFQLPPPALEARATLEVSAGAGWAGRTGTGVAVGTDEAWATAGSVPPPGGFGGGCGVTHGQIEPLYSASTQAIAIDCGE